MSEDFASLVVLSYHRPDLTEQCLNSLITVPTQHPFELIVVDDGSRDANWPRLNQRVRNRQISDLVINAGNNRGVGVGMNRGFALARGKWVVKLDTDLVFQPNWLDRGIEILENFPQVAVVGFFDYRHYVAGDTRFNRLGAFHQGTRIIGWEVDDFVGSAFMIRRDDWLKYGVIDNKWRGFEEGSAAFAEDIEWKLKMKDLGFQCAITEPDVMQNVGFGLGNSTVVVADEQGEPVVAKISNEPVLFGGLRKDKLDAIQA